MKLKDWVNLNRGIFLERDLYFLIKNAFPGSTDCHTEATVLNEPKLQYLEKVKKLYKKGLLLPYILGKEEFFGWEFRVNPSVLIPRPETELIVERAASLIKDKKLKIILDLGTGAGNIAISLKKIFREKIKVLACDKSLAALFVAKENVYRHNAAIKLISTDLFNGFKNNCFDLVVSNPPYVEAQAICGSLKYEPRIALEAGREGLYFIKRILKMAPQHLKKEGYLILEVGYSQRKKIAKLIENLDYQVIDWIKDYSGHWRGLILKTKNKKWIRK